MKVIITGGLGFVGTQLSKSLLKEGYEVTVVDYSTEPRPYTPHNVKYISADTTIPGRWQEDVLKQDAIINLAGASIFQRWNSKTKDLIYSSRISTTRNLVDAISGEKLPFLCSTSAVGYYGFQDDKELVEEDSPGGDFLARLCVDWEREALKALDKGVRVTVTRFGIVLGKTGGALGQMISAFKKYVGGPLGSGDQWFSWIHMDDLLNAFLLSLIMMLYKALLICVHQIRYATRNLPRLSVRRFLDLLFKNTFFSYSAYLRGIWLSCS